jgi:iron complex transport system substrate-binding protein
MHLPPVRGVNASRGAAVALLLLALALWFVATGPAGAAAKAPQRIVALTPFAANTLVKLGIEPVGVGQTLGGNERFSPKLEGIPVLPLSHPNGPNLEQLAALDPDLVFSSRTWAKGNESIGDLGIEVRVQEPFRLNGAYAQTRVIGGLVGKRRQAEALAESMKRSVARARKGIAERPTVMLILGVGRTPFVFLPNSWGGDMVTKAGGRLLTGGVSSGSGFERISDEVVVAEDPDVIIAVPHASEDDIPSLTEYLRTNPAWQTTSAVRDGRIHISVDNSLLQPGTDVARTIRKVRRAYLEN